MNPDDRQSLVMYRLEQARQTLEDAKRLQCAGGSALSIANRAYYSMFYACLALLQGSGAMSSKHSGVISLFDREFVLKGVFPKAMSRALHRAFDLRQQGDYAELRTIADEEAAEVVRDAEAFVAQIETRLGKA